MLEAGSANSIRSFGAALEPDVAQEIYSDPGLVAAGALNPQGRAVRVDGGYRVTGQWPFASGCHNAHWFWGQCIVTDGQESIRDDTGNVELIEATIPFADFEILDTWHVAGMRGSGSHDVAVSDVMASRSAHHTDSSERAGWHAVHGREPAVSIPVVRSSCL